MGTTSYDANSTWGSFHNPDATPEQVSSYSAALSAMRDFQNAFSEAAADPETLDRLAADLQAWTEALSPLAMPEQQRHSGRMLNLPARGHSAIPPFVVESTADDRVAARVVFDSFYLGGGGAAHGGMIMTVLDEVMGIQACLSGRGIARTAYLTVNFRSLVLIGAEIQIRTRIEREEGRKRFVRAEMWSGETLCAEADALFIELRRS